MWSSDPFTTPTVSICGSTSPLKVSTWWSQQQTSLRGGLSSGSCPKKVQKTEVRELIVMCFDHLLEAHAHMSSFVANISSLAKITNPETFDMVMKAAARLMIQVNISEHYLSLVQDPLLKTTAEEHLSRLEKVILPRPASLTQEPWYGPTRLLAAVVWLCLKHKFFNGGTTKEACTTFEV